MKNGISLLFILIQLSFYSQRIELTIYGADEKEMIINSKSSLDSKEQATAIWLKLIEQGYLSASIDSLSVKDSLQHYASIKKGERYKLATFSTNIPDEIRDKIGIPKNKNKASYFSPIELKNIIQKILGYCSNNGHPFAAIKINKSTINKTEINVQLELEIGPRIIVKEIILPKELNGQSAIIQQIINIKVNEQFNESKIKAISSRIKETSYLKEIKPAEYEIINNKLSLYLYVKNTSAKFINGVIGIQPQENEKISFTGDANIRLENAFKIGEKLSLNWKKMYALSQSLDAQISFPYLFKSSFGIFNKTDMMKKDSSFFNLNNRFGSSFSFTKRKTVRFYYQYNLSNSLQSSLTNQRNTQLNAIGLSFESNDLDYIFNPRKGLYVKGDFKLGNKTIINSEDSTNNPLKTIDYQLNIKIYNFFRFGKNSTIKIGGNYQSIINPLIYENELLRIGGNNDLRGFDEQSILVSSFAIAEVEYRLILEENSNIFCFFNYAWTEKKTTLVYRRDNPFSGGIGINFETKPGIFSISYALGAQENNPILFKTAKIHFGFVNYF